MTRSTQGQARQLLEQVDLLAAPHGLIAMGGTQGPPDGPARTIVLLGTGPAFWAQFTQSAEYLNGAPDPVDRWSLRVLPLIMAAAGAHSVVYPFGGPPYAPFIAWAKQTGEAFDSPVGMLVHARAGLMISYRGALVFEGHLAPASRRPANPCLTCEGKPCVTACPVDALSDKHFYDVPACKAFLARNEGQECMTRGCAVRRACPVSQRFGRPEPQSAHHMRAFKGA